MELNDRVLRLPNVIQTRSIDRKPGGGSCKFSTRKIAGYKSEVLVLGGVPEKGDVVLLQPTLDVPNGTPIA